MYLPTYLNVLTCLLPLTSLAMSDQAQTVLDDISSLQKSLDSNEQALSQYKGGLISAAPLANEFYNTWSTLRVANDHVPADTNFTSEESDEVLHGMDSANDVAIGLFKSVKEKAQMLNKAGAGFTVPIFMDALYREADEYMGALKALMPLNYTPPMDQITASHTKFWNAAFASFEPADTSNSTRQFKRFTSMATPLLGYFF
ncbi:hypothetical protein N7494_002564 [Penicillium frequentans]|uniref:Uncharacterized protein n=1 Tax=Penicillium frequentans TaxID=3151616 RepID=A0AAD6D3W4_9EURO|nr:hypothetical protein N7494_002564 [Penicillium glabrum]